MPLHAPRGCVVLARGTNFEANCDRPDTVVDHEAVADVDDDHETVATVDDDHETTVDDDPPETRPYLFPRCQWLLPASDVATREGLRKTIKKYFGLETPESLSICSNTVAGPDETGGILVAVIDERDWERMFKLGIFDHISVEQAENDYFVYVSMGPWEIGAERDNDYVGEGRGLKRLREA